jgi:ankyrin repeat protein
VHYEKIRSLSENPSYDLQKKYELGNTLLHLAAKNGYLDIVTDLIKKRAPINSTNDYQETPLRLAIVHEHVRVVAFLLRKGAHTELKNIEGNTVLHAAVTQRNIRLIKVLLDGGALINSTDLNGQTSLHYAVTLEDLDMINQLLERNANIDAQSANGWTAIHHLIDLKSFKKNPLKNYQQENEVLKCLLEKGANLEIKDHQWKTPMQSNPAPSIKRQLLEAGAIDYAPSLRDLKANQQRILHFLYLALYRNEKSRIKILLARCNVNEIEEKDYNKLLSAIGSFSTPDVFEFLLTRLNTIRENIGFIYHSAKKESNKTLMLHLENNYAREVFDKKMNLYEVRNDGAFEIENEENLKRSSQLRLPTIATRDHSADHQRHPSLITHLKERNNHPFKLKNTQSYLKTQQLVPCSHIAIIFRKSLSIKEISSKQSLSSKSKNNNTESKHYGS